MYKLAVYNLMLNTHGKTRHPESKKKVTMVFANGGSGWAEDGIERSGRMPREVYLPLTVTESD